MRASNIFSMALALSACSHAMAQELSEPAKLTAAQAFWESRLPKCEGFISKEFPERKETPDGKVFFEPCNDGDTVLFSGLSCSIGDARGCEAVKNSQSIDGRWWRSPRKLRLAIPDGGSETTFSNDHAAGVWAYIAETRDKEAFKSWTKWIDQNKKTFDFIPRYCQDSRCTFKLMDCPMLDRLAVVLGTSNQLCDAVPSIGVVSGPDPSVVVRETRTALNNVENALRSIPGVGDLLALVPVQLANKALEDMENAAKKLEARASHIRVLARVATDTTGVVGRLNAMVNDPGFSRHNIAVDAYLLQKYTTIPSPLTLDAAKKVATIEPQNAFMHFVANGPSSEMLQLIYKKCRTKDDSTPHPRFQWIWERADNDPKNPAADTMYWDCLFVAKLYSGGPIQKVALPDIPGMTELYKIEQAAFDAAKSRADQAIRDLEELKEKPTLKGVVKVITAPDEIVKGAQGAAGGQVGGAIGKAIGGESGEKAGKALGQTAADPTKPLRDEAEKRIPDIKPPDIKKLDPRRW